MDSNPICHPSPANKMKCSFLDYVQLLMIGQAGRWTQTPSTTPLQPIKWNASFGFVFTSDDQPGLLMDSNPILHPSPDKKIKCSLLDYIHFGWSARLVNGLKPHPPPLYSQKHEMLIFGLCSTSDDQLGWSMESNPILHLSPAKKMKCSFLDYVHFWWSAWLIDELEPHLPPLSYQKNEMLLFQIHSTSIDQPGWSMDSNPILHPSPTKKMKCSFLDYVQLLMISRAGRWPQTPSATPLQPIKWNAHFELSSTSDDQPGW